MNLKTHMFTSLLMVSGSGFATLESGSTAQNLITGELYWLNYGDGEVCIKVAEVGQRSKLVPIVDLRESKIDGKDVLLCGESGHREKQSVEATYKKLGSSLWVDSNDLAWDYEMYETRNETAISYLSQVELNQLAAKFPDLAKQYPEYFDKEHYVFRQYFKKKGVDLSPGGADHRLATLYCAMKDMRLPSRDEIVAANKDGALIEQFPEMGHRFFWLSSADVGGYLGFVFDGFQEKLGFIERHHGSVNMSARCVREADAKN